MPKIPFQRITLVRLVSAANPPPDGPEDEAIQTAHIKYLRGLVDKGTILANGPVKRIDDTRARGMGLYLVGPDEARRIANEDPAVKAGWFEVMVDEWLIPNNPKMIADRKDLEIDVPD